jgi:hypothetical protein
MPLFLVYLRTVLLPTANLGIVAEAQLGGSLGASLTWRASDRAPIGRARFGVGLLLISALTLCALRAPVAAAIEVAAVLMIAAASGVALTTTSQSIMEMMHRNVNDEFSAGTVMLPERPYRLRVLA